MDKKANSQQSAFKVAIESLESIRDPDHFLEHFYRSFNQIDKLPIARERILDLANGEAYATNQAEISASISHHRPGYVERCRVSIQASVFNGGLIPKTYRRCLLL